MGQRLAQLGTLIRIESKGDLSMSTTKPIRRVTAKAVEHRIMAGAWCPLTACNLVSRPRATSAFHML